MAEGTSFYGQIGAAEGVSGKRLFGSELGIVMALSALMTGNQRLGGPVRNALFDLGRPRLVTPFRCGARSTDYMYFLEKIAHECSCNTDHTDFHSKHKQQSR